MTRRLRPDPAAPQGPPPQMAPDAGMPGSGFAWTVVPRHGQRPMAFWGRLLLQAAHREPDLPVWSDLALHETDRGHFVVALRHLLRRRDGEPDGLPLCYAVSSPDAADLRRMLAAHDPMADLPADLLLGAAEFEDPYAAGLLAARLRGAWRALLAATFGDSPVASPMS